jgi:CRP/FNR family transcriptional regulator, nitrogen oxide reductase regulator
MMFRFIMPGDFFGYQAVFNDSFHYFTTAEAAEDSEALSFSRAATRKLLHSHAAIAINALSTSLKVMQEYQERLAEMACVVVSSRIARRLLQLESSRRKNGPVSIDEELTREDLAGLAGSTLHTVSRILGRWEQQRIVEKSRGRVRIVDRSKLMQIARL